MSELSMLALSEQIQDEGVCNRHIISKLELTAISSKKSALSQWSRPLGTWVPVPEETPEMPENMWPRWLVSMKYLAMNLRFL